jgi:hypothetical protein
MAMKPISARITNSVPAIGLRFRRPPQHFASQLAVLADELKRCDHKFTLYASACDEEVRILVAQ